MTVTETKPAGWRSGTLPDGVALMELEPLADHRGVFTEVFRQSWKTGVKVVQISLVDSVARTLRGSHIHLQHAEIYVAAAGAMLVGMTDLRPASPTFGKAGLVRLDADDRRLLAIPPGVAHAYYSETDTVLLVGVSSYYDPSDDLGCRWDDPELGVDWPPISPILSARDAGAVSLAELRQALAARGLA